VKEKLLTVHETAKLLNIGIFTVYRMAQKGKIPSYKIGNARRFKKEEIEKWLATQKSQGES
jgi:excisionase family DNA binding protein